MALRLECKGIPNTLTTGKETGFMNDNLTASTHRHHQQPPLVLLILDGWGYRRETDHNAIALAHTPNWNDICERAQVALIDTSGESVGLPAGQMGNSEVGHMNIGAGRMVYQDFTRIEKAIDDGSFNANAALGQAIDDAAARNKSVHIMGLLSPGGVHSHEDQLFATLRLAADKGAASISIHAFLDGRDTPPRSALASIDRLQELVDTVSGAEIRTVSGRYYAMDRDQRWSRTRAAFQAIASAQTEFVADSARQAVEDAYERGESDEFVRPTLVSRASSKETGGYPGVQEGDSMVFINFRADRARQLTRAFVENPFEGFERNPPRLSSFVCMTEYLAGLPVAVAFPTEPLSHLFGAELADHGLKQLRIAETEKYAHVTFFFNGGEERPFPGEERILIPSPDVATYDVQPEMSAPELSRQLVEAIGSGHFDVIICNVANPDMVGHTGKLDAAILAVEAVDHLLGAVAAAVASVGGDLLITADHGNVEQMSDDSTGQVHTAHTTNPVPFVYLGRDVVASERGALRDIAPTMLHLLGLPQPPEMTGQPLVRLKEPVC